MKNKKLLGFLALLSATLIWGTSFVVLKTTLNDISVFWVLAIRFIIAAVVFGIFSIRRRDRFSRELIVGGLLMGSTMAAAYIFQTFGLYYTTPGKNAFLTASYCVLVPFMAWFIYKRKPTLINVFAAVVCMVGIGFISMSEGFGIINKGDALTLVCGIFYGLQLVIIEEYVVKCDVTVLTFVEFLTSAVICLAGAILFEEAPSSVPLPAVAKILYMAFICTGLCFFLQAWGQQYTSSAVTAVVLPLESVFGALISVIFYNEALTRNFIIGAVLMTAAIVFNELGTSK